MKKIVTVLIMLALIFGLGVTQTEALTLTKYDLGEIWDEIKDFPVGEQVVSTAVATFPDEPSIDLGLLTGNVYRPDGSTVYTYVMEFEPYLPNVCEFSTSFTVEGFVPNDPTTKVGFDYQMAHDAALPYNITNPSLAFVIYQDSDGRIEWDINKFYQLKGLWKTNLAPIKFFYQSTIGPGNGEIYSIFSTYTATAENRYPCAAVPEPSTAILLFSCLIGFGLLVKRYKKEA